MMLAQSWRSHLGGQWDVQVFKIINFEVHEKKVQHSIRIQLINRIEHFLLITTIDLQRS